MIAEKREKIPTPYYLLPARTLIHMKGPLGQLVCSMDLKDELTAKFIVKACNTHDTHVRACMMAYAALIHYTPNNMKKALDAIDEAQRACM